MQKIVIVEGTFPPIVVRVDADSRPDPVVLSGTFPWSVPQVGTDEYCRSVPQVGTREWVQEYYL